MTAKRMAKAEEGHDVSAGRAEGEDSAPAHARDVTFTEAPLLAGSITGYDKANYAWFGGKYYTLNHPQCVLNLLAAYTASLRQERDEAVKDAARYREAHDNHVEHVISIDRDMRRAEASLSAANKQADALVVKVLQESGARERAEASLSEMRRALKTCADTTQEMWQLAAMMLNAVIYMEDTFAKAPRLIECDDAQAQAAKGTKERLNVLRKQVKEICAALLTEEKPPRKEKL